MGSWTYVNGEDTCIIKANPLPKIPIAVSMVTLENSFPAPTGPWRTFGQWRSQESPWCDWRNLAEHCSSTNWADAVLAGCGGQVGLRTAQNQGADGAALQIAYEDWQFFLRPHRRAPAPMAFCIVYPAALASPHPFVARICQNAVSSGTQLPGRPWSRFLGLLRSDHLVVPRVSEIYGSLGAGGRLRIVVRRYR